MANEITANGLLQVAKGNVSAKSLNVASTFTLNGSNYDEGSFTVPTTAGGTVIPVANLTGANLGWFFFKNNDATNYIQILSAVSGTVFLKLKPGEFAIGRFDAGITAPAAVSNTATCQLEYLICND